VREYFRCLVSCRDSHVVLRTPWSDMSTSLVYPNQILHFVQNDKLQIRFSRRTCRPPQNDNIKYPCFVIPRSNAVATWESRCRSVILSVTQWSEESGWRRLFQQSCHLERSEKSVREYFLCLVSCRDSHVVLCTPRSDMSTSLVYRNQILHFVQNDILCSTICRINLEI